MFARPIVDPGDAWPRRRCRERAALPRKAAVERGAAADKPRPRHVDHGFWGPPLDSGRREDTRTTAHVARIHGPDPGGTGRLRLYRGPSEGHRFGDPGHRHPVLD